MHRKRTIKKLTPSKLRRIVLDETKRMLETLETGIEDISKVKAKEVAAGDEAGTLEKDIDHMKVLKIKEAKLARQLIEVRKKRSKLKRRISKRL